MPAAEPVPRRVYITRATLARHGLTDGCVGCTSTFLGRQALPHSETCRARIERAMREDPADRMRLKESSIKRKAFVEKHMADPKAASKRKRSLEDDGEDAARGDRPRPEVPGDVTLASRAPSQTASGPCSSSGASSSIQPSVGMEVGEGQPLAGQDGRLAEDSGKRKREPGDEGTQDLPQEDIDEYGLYPGLMDVVCEGPEEDVLESMCSVPDRAVMSAESNEGTEELEKGSFREVLDDLTGVPLDWGDVYKARMDEV